ncbi:tRNA pseudouridine(55) synthase TruB [Parvibium lacunae]|uniref:tRNA pseudouridine synthase B n=1 Tax=Parvibium lacunae TaxID=1888893 RepID=A0A368L6T3_9BURK|nr:tRNA pseudouridine(55) synthase TruB [Parvibium lacunae]RCS59324.1 tRNA pseudouridine(55) synthase TruB [Parvibium lacunae]
MHGVLLLDKPLGLSSNQALGKAKFLLKIKKAGHTGTLDPLATGLLPLCFGEATKFSADLLEADKTYETVVKLGITTTTGDAEGEVLTQTDHLPNLTQIEAVLPQFRGEIEQVPPMYSALKHQGKALYEYARNGVEVVRAARRVTIHQLDCLRYDAVAGLLALRVRCSKGTYIRTLGEEIGQALGCGGYLQTLRRLAVGELTIADALTLEVLSQRLADKQPVLAPLDTLLQGLPKIALQVEWAQRFRHGQRLALRSESHYAGQLASLFTSAQLTEETRLVRVYDDQAQLLGTAELNANGRLQPQRLVSLN